MFPMTRPVRHAIATGALFVLTVVPTIYVVFTSWRINRPGHLHEVESEIGHALGMHVTLEGVAYPRPGEVVYRGIVLRQEEPRHKGLTEIARAGTLRVRRAHRELSLETDGLKLRGESPKLAMAQVGSILQKPGDQGYDRISLSAPTCELDLGTDGLRYSLNELAGTFQADRSAPAMTVSYRVTSKGSNTRCELNLVRDRKIEPVRTTLTLKTMDGLPLPAKVLDIFFDTNDWFGPAAKVEGALTLRQTGAKDWEADFQGDLLDVDLAALVGRRFPGQYLSGLARVMLKTARWADRPGQGFGWVETRGELSSGQGSIGVGLLKALGSEMKFRLAPRLAKLDDRKPVLDFRALGFSFAMTPDGEIRFAGALGNEYAPDVVIATPTSPIAYAPEGTANVRGLIKTLFPVTDASAPGLMVPLTTESRILLCLPVPPDLAAKPTARLGGN
jgi:hypothetical protein